jgi:GNAT superfamily N-acetyltransferase
MSYPRPAARFRIMNRLFGWLPVKSKLKFHALLLKKKLDSPEKPEARPGLGFSIASENDIEEISEHEEALAKQLYSRRVSNGDICYCLRKDGELVSYNWIRFTSCCAHCGRRVGFEFVPLERNQAFTYDFYTYKKYRGSGLGGYLKSHLLDDLHARGIDEVLSIVKPSNAISMRIHARLDYEPVMVVFGYSMFNCSKVFIGSEKDLLRMQQWMAALAEAVKAK